jgi:hypothetical protein
MTDIVLDKMKQLGVEPTRQNYLTFAYFGTPPEHLTAEEEAQLPEQFQQFKPKEGDNATNTEEPETEG